MGLKNHTLIKRINRAKILDTIRRNGTVARAQIADQTGLDRKSVTNFVNALIDGGLVEESGKQENAVGRPFTMLSFKPHYAAGVYIAPRHVQGTLLDLHGNIIAVLDEEYPFYPELPVLLAAVKRLLNRLVAVRRPDLGIGVCMPGFLDVANGIIIDSVNIPALKGFPFRDFLAEIVDLPVFFEEESRAVALAEKWFGAGQAHDDFVVVEVSEGIGAGFVNDRRLFKGAGQYAGEIGHLTIEPEGVRCRCGNNGCLEAYASERAVAEKLGGGSGRLRDLDRKKIDADQYLLAMNETGAKLAVGLAAVINILCPRIIILSGSVIDFFQHPLLDSIRRHLVSKCHKSSLEQTSILISEISGNNALGAATLPLSAVYEVPGFYYV